MRSSKGIVTLLTLGLLNACQTRSQAKIVAVGTGSIGLVGGYFEYKASATGDALPPLTLISGGAIAILSAASIFFLDEQPRTLFETTPQDWRPDTRRGAAELVAAIRRTGCFGRCPAYSVAVYRDGVIEYRGESNVRTRRVVIGQLSADQLGALEAHFIEAKFVAFSKSYLELDCTDLPTVYTWYRPVGRSTNSVAHYLGDRSAPKELFMLEEAFDIAVSVEQWIGPKEEHPGPHAMYCR
jgi:hypothetical protein